MINEMVRVSVGPANKTYQLSRRQNPFDLEMAVSVSPTAVVDWLEALHKGCFITDKQVLTGMRWREDWLVFAQAMQSADEGNICANQNIIDTAGLRLADVRETLGVAAEQWLVMLLVENLAMPVLAEALYPGLPKPTGRHAVLNTFTFVLEQLTERYEWLDDQF